MNSTTLIVQVIPDQFFATTSQLYFILENTTEDLMVCLNVSGPTDLETDFIVFFDDPLTSLLGFGKLP